MLNALHGITNHNNRANVVSFVALDGRDESTVLGLAASAVRGLETPVATAIVESARQRTIPMHHVDHCHETTRAGIVASVAGHTVVVGHSALFVALGLPIDALGGWPQRLRKQNQSVLFIAIDGQTAGFLGIQEDEMRNAIMTNDHFSAETAGLPVVHSPERLELANGDALNLRIAPVAKNLQGAVVRMLAYNGSIPGPTLYVEQGSELLVTVVNEGDLEATVHWHGLRLENRYDGTTDTQPPIPVDGVFTYRLTFPDPGIYWYHPHIREDYGQEMGLYGNVVVRPSDPDYWPRVNREVVLTLDDILLDAGRVAPFSRSESTYTAMGRFGDVLLVNGETELSLSAQQGEVVRFYLTNTANTRVFNVSLRGARMKLVGGDSGRYEQETFVDDVVVAPSERTVVDVLFDRPGRIVLEHRTPKRIYPLATITVVTESAQPSLATEFARLRTNPDLVSERERVVPYLEAPPNKTIALVAEMNMGGSAAAGDATVTYVCPMHPEVTSDHADRCPKCGMKLVPAQLVAQASEGHHHDHSGADVHEHHHEHGRGQNDEVPAGIEWEDDMVDVNRMTTPANMRWKLIDRATGADGSAIDWQFRVGDQVKIQLTNEMDSDHPMQHPFHIHGAGRFLILSRDGVAEPNLVWKDTVLVPTGQTVDILLDVTNPGVWMAHCHIAEHHESGMMFRFTVKP